VEAAEVVTRIIEKANHLSGEPFTATTPITSLSGGQSRALMIADTAILSQSPIILIDEIENAGIDRKKAMDLLVGEEKIVLIATHDPSLALMADKRIQIRNGGIQSVSKTDEQEKQILGRLEEIDKLLGDLRKQLRQGETLSLPAEYAGFNL
jgi:ABC-type lipoprotein export system ATPase subunit